MNQQREELQPTSAAEWRRPRQEGVTVELPSGNIAVIRPVALDVLMQQGEIPDLLTPLASKLLWTSIKTEDIQTGSAENQIEHTRLINIIVPAALLSPKVYIPPAVDDDAEDTVKPIRLADDEVLLEDIDFDDKLLIFRLSILPVEQIRSFRDKQNEFMENLSNVDGDTSATE